MNLLIVEDDAELQQAWAQALESQGHATGSMTHEQAAHHALPRGTVQLALIGLPSAPAVGLPLVCRWRQDDPMLGIIVVDASHSPSDRIEALQSGADNCLTKPIPLAELIASVQALVRRLSASAAATIAPRKGQTLIEVDSSSLQIRGPLGVERLTTSEFALLSGLASASGSPLPPTKIYQLLGRDPRNRPALEAMVYRLRRKLTLAGAGENSIRAHRLQGYQLSCALRIV